jgi:hypothetical protein
MEFHKYDNSRYSNERVREVMALDSSPVPEWKRKKIEYSIRAWAVASDS